MDMSLEALWREKERGTMASCDDRTPVAEALGRMADNPVRALIVVSREGGRPLGIFTSTDLLRCHVTRPSTPLARIGLADVMSHPLIVAQSNERVQDALALMINADIRHLPIIKDDALMGVLTLKDLAEHHTGALKAEIDHLQDYIHTLQEAARD